MKTGHGVSCVVFSVPLLTSSAMIQSLMSVRQGMSCCRSGLSIRSGGDGDSGGRDTFFAWFFRGEGPGRVISGANVQRRFISSRGALATFFEDNHVAQVLECGAMGYVSKTSGSRELLRGVRAVAAGQAYLCRETAAMMEYYPERSEVVAGEAALARKEIEVLQQIAKGDSAADIERRLHLTSGLVEIHQRNIMRKLGLRSGDELRQYALRAGLIQSTGQHPPA